MDQQNPFGASFVPGADQASSGGFGGMAPQAQQAIQFLNLQLPKQPSAQAPTAAPLMAPAGGSTHADLASAVVRSVLRALGHDVPGPGGMPQNAPGGMSVPGMPTPGGPGAMGAGPGGGQESGQLLNAVSNAPPTPTPTFSFDTGAPPGGSPTAGDAKLPGPPPMQSAFRSSGGGKY